MLNGSSSERFFSITCPSQHSRIRIDGANSASTWRHAPQGVPDQYVAAGGPQDHHQVAGLGAAQRGHGYGRRLTEALLQYLSNLGADYTTLEVRESNEVAIGLYRSLGFVKVGVRKRYYSDTNEDGFIMVCDRLPPAQEGFEEPETVRE